MAGGFFGNIELLTRFGWVAADQIVVGDSVATWDSDTSEVRVGELVSKTVEHVTAANVVFLRGTYMEQKVAESQRVWGSKFLYSEVGHEPRWIRVQERVQSEGGYDRVCVSGFHYGSGCGLSTEEVSVAGLLYSRTITGAEKSIVFDVALNGTDRSYKIEKTLRRLAEKFPEDVEIVETEKSVTFNVSGLCFRRINDFYQSIYLGHEKAYEILWTMSLVEKNVFLWFAVHGQDSRVQRYGWCVDVGSEAGAVWLQTLAALAGMKSSSYSAGERFVVSIQQEAEVKPFIEEHFVDTDSLVRISVNSEGFLARQAGTIFVAANS